MHVQAPEKPGQGHSMQACATMALAALRTSFTERSRLTTAGEATATLAATRAKMAENFILLKKLMICLDADGIGYLVCVSRYLVCGYR